MLKQWQFVVLTVVAVAATALAVSNMAMFVQNRDLQIQVGTRSQFIQQSGQLQNLYRDLVNGLADLATRNQDQGIRDLLAAQGIGPAAAPPSTTPSRPATGDAKQGSKQ